MKHIITAMLGCACLVASTCSDGNSITVKTKYGTATFGDGKQVLR